MIQTEILRFLTSLQGPVLDSIAQVLTFLGNEEFYFLLIPLIFWCIHKQVGFQLFYIFLLSMYVNAFLKITFAVPRPIGVEGVQSLFVSSAEVGSHYPNDSFPSGHAQGSTTLWAYIAAVVRKPWFYAFAAVLILLIAVSRLYTGLHWPLDVLAGIALGVAFVAIGLFISAKVQKLPAFIVWTIIFILPIALVIFLPATEGYQYGGILLGASVGYMLERQTSNFTTSQSFGRKVVAYVIGILFTFGIQVGGKELLPATVEADAIRYGFIGLWITLLWPWSLVKLSIYKSGDSKKRRKKTR
ncbi:phosphatase PAP2 family protein [Paenalkalicoccus suaedae]|uniref:Phosphatase PAP2 family protein n=1 Tax=Paenalkalicoccus suaedae TaxID=2592382 RepID=A0A859FIR4_9BACI|nr:phosphatase PAP2 family protein [Paenalkalicoccus suaedae]QKS72155.1 phosphatase PAP2 family protein [Paenalkalicoccus suaedae]